MFRSSFQLLTLDLLLHIPHAVLTIHHIQIPWQAAVQKGPPKQFPGIHGVREEREEEQKMEREAQTENNQREKKRKEPPEPPIHQRKTPP